MAMMLNNFTVLVGFMRTIPKLTEDESFKEKCCVFTISTKDHKSIKEVMCLATGMLVEQLMVYGQRGTFWAISGIIHLHRNKSSKKPQLAIKVLEIELLKRPTIPGITAEEFVEGYSPKAITKRAKERKNGKDS